MGVPDHVIESITGRLSRRMLEHYSHVRLEAKRQGLEAPERTAGRAGLSRRPDTNRDDSVGRMPYVTKNVTGVIAQPMRIPVTYREHSCGEMSERLKEHAWKACVGVTLPWVRIPLSPPYYSNKQRLMGDTAVLVVAAICGSRISTSSRSGRPRAGRPFVNTEPPAQLPQPGPNQDGRLCPPRRTSLAARGERPSSLGSTRLTARTTLRAWRWANDGAGRANRRCGWPPQICRRAQGTRFTSA